MLHRSGLVIANVAGQGEQLRKAPHANRRMEGVRRRRVSNILAMRFKGIDPERMLNWLYPKLKWMYSDPAVVCCMLLMLACRPDCW